MKPAKEPGKKIFQKFYANKHVSIPTLLIIGIIVGAFSYRAISTNQIKIISDERTCISNLTLIRPNIDCKLFDEKNEELSVLQEKLATEIAAYEKSGDANRIGVFVRDLKSTRFAAVNDTENFYMASLLKLPLIIAGYKYAEVEPKILEQKIQFTKDKNLYTNQTIKVSEELKIGQSYTIEELMKRSIIYSDNTAAQMIADSLSPGFFDLILKALGIQYVKEARTDENLITPRRYANVFRILYNTSYLTSKYSNDTLTILTEAKYKDGSLARLPKDVIVAHKFAERTNTDTAGKIELRQLHECGLVYGKQGNEPYIFCIMTEGKDFAKLEKIQQNISKDIFDMIVGE